MSSPSISIIGVSKRYKNVSMTYPDIKITSNRVILVGPNGSGKSTLLKAIVGLVEYEGRIQCEGSISFMPEHPNLPKDCTVIQFLTALGGQNVVSWLKRFDIYHKKDELCTSLSKGMKGKVNLIQCLIEDAAWYFLDEPTSGLDEGTLQELKRWLQTTSRKWIVSTHQDNLFSNLGAEVITLVEHT